MNKQIKSVPVETSTNPVQSEMAAAPVPKPNPRYALLKGLGYWEVFFKGERGFFKHERGAYYVAHLLLNPPGQPIHGLALNIAVAAARGEPIAPLQITDPITGRTVTLDGDGTFQQRSLGFEEFDAACALRKTQLALETIVDDDDQIGPVKAEALRDLEAIYNFQKTNLGRTKDAAQRAVHAVRMALLRFHEHLAGATDHKGQPHPVLRPFAKHLQKHLLIPSGRFAKSGGPRRHLGLAGCFTYEPPRGVVWQALDM